MANDKKWEPVGTTATAPAWKPENEKDEVSGIYIDKKENVGPNASNFYTLEQPDGSFKGVWGSTVIDDRMTSIALGDEVKIVYLGKVPSKTAGRQPFKQFEIFRKPGEGVGPAAVEGSEDVNPDDVPF